MPATTLTMSEKARFMAACKKMEELYDLELIQHAIEKRDLDAAKAEHRRLKEAKEADEKLSRDLRKEREKRIKAKQDKAKAKREERTLANAQNPESMIAVDPKD